MHSTLFENCTVFDGVSPQLKEGMHVLVEDAHIKEVADRPIQAAEARRIDVGGRVLMPGMIDAHFHALLADLNVPGLDTMPPSLLHQHAHINLAAALNRGFTTVRDAGGADFGLAQAVEEGLIRGPRVFFSGKALSQTGGHGDMRSAHFEACACVGYRGHITEVADGVDALRKAVREELRKGATQIKLMVSGGVLSPSDPVWMDQYSDEEIRAAVEEAATRRTYVMAHAHPASAVKRCIELGVRSIEHGTLIDEETADLVSKHDAFVVPTLSTIKTMMDHGTELGLPAVFAGKLAGLLDEGKRAVELCHRAGASLGLGTDLIGALHEHQSLELLIRGEITSPFDVLHSVTAVNAELLNRNGDLGIIAEGAIADLLVVDGNPLEDLGLLQDQGHHLPVIMKGGELHKYLLLSG